MQLSHLDITPGLLKLIAEIDEFKGSWKVLKILSLERLQSLRHVATIESIGSSTRIEKLNPHSCGWTTISEWL